MSLFALVYDKMRRALATKQVHRGEHGWQLELDEPVTGRIEADPARRSQPSISPGPIDTCAA